MASPKRASPPERPNGRAEVAPGKPGLRAVVGDREFGSSEERTDIGTGRPDSSRQARGPIAVWSSIALLLVVATGASWWWFHGGREQLGHNAGRDTQAAPPNGSRAAAGAQGPRRIPVEVATVRTVDLPVYLEGLGTVQAYNSVTVRSRVDGEVIEIAFREGDTVKAGDLLARIDPRPYKAALDQAVAKKKQDEATLASTRLDLQRTQQLAKSSFASQQQLDQQTANVGAQTALLAIDQAQIDNAETQLSYTAIRAPLTGRLGLRMVDQGNIVRATDQAGIVEIAQLQPISVLFTAPEGQLGAIASAEKAGDVQVQALSSDGKTTLGAGVLALINNMVDAASGTVRLKATFPNEDDKLWPGLSINTRLLARTLKDAVVVPENAVMRGADGQFVFVVGQDRKAEKRVIKLGVFSEGQAVIEEGLRPGDTIVTAGQSRLTNGAEVSPAGGGPEGGFASGAPRPASKDL